MPNGRILRVRLDLTYALSASAGVHDVSVYGTSSGFRGRAYPGDSFTADAAGEYSVTRKLGAGARCSSISTTTIPGVSGNPAVGRRRGPQRLSGPIQDPDMPSVLRPRRSSTTGTAGSACLVGVRMFVAGA